MLYIFHCSVEVNGVNIGNENHEQVIERIKTNPNESQLLVVDRATDSYYKERNIVIKGTLSSVLYLKTPTIEEEEKLNGMGLQWTFFTKTVRPSTLHFLA